MDKELSERNVFDSGPRNALSPRDSGGRFNMKSISELVLETEVGAGAGGINGGDCLVQFGPRHGPFLP